MTNNIFRLNMSVLQSGLKPEILLHKRKLFTTIKLTYNVFLLQLIFELMLLKIVAVKYNKNKHRLG